MFCLWRRCAVPLFLAMTFMPVALAEAASSDTVFTCLLDGAMAGGSAKDLPVEVKIAAATDQLTVADTITVSWRVLKEDQAGCKTPRYLFVSMPDIVRLEGSGLVALRPGQDAPFGIMTDRSKLRVVIPLYFGNASREGRFRITLAKAGHFDLDWFVAEVPKADIGSTDPASLLRATTLAIAPADSAQQWEVGPGKPAIYVEDRYSLEKPEQIITSNDGSYVLRVFKGFFQVHDSRSQRLILEAAGWKPNFSPTSRFLAAYGGVSAQASFNVSVFDLVTGQPIFQPEKERVAQFSLRQEVTQIAWFAHDSFALLAAPSLTGSVVFQTVVDDAAFSIRGQCNACGVWDARFNYDNDLLTFDDGATGPKYLAFPDLERAAEAKWLGETDEKTLAGDAMHGEILSHADILDQPEVKDSPGDIAWHLGETFGLSHSVKVSNGPGNPLDYVVPHAEAPPSASKARSASGMSSYERVASRGVIILSNQPALQSTELWSERVQARLSAFGIEMAPGMSGHHEETTANAVEGGAFGPRFAKSVAAQSAFAKTVFATDTRDSDSAPGCLQVDEWNEALFGEEQTSPAQLMPPDWWADWKPAWGDPRVATNPLYIFATWRWNLQNEKLWAYQTVCANGGSGEFTQGMVGLLRQGADGKADAVWLSNLKWQGKRLNDLLALSRPESITASISQDRYLLLGSRNASAFVAVYDLKERKLIAGISDVRDGFLTQHLELTSDGRSLLQWNEDGQFHLYDLSTFKRFLSGYYLDDEIVLYDDHGYYDSTAEGASFVHLAFSGAPEAHDLQQFARTLRRPDVIRAALTRQSTVDAAPQLSAPPRLTAEIATRQRNAITLNVDAAAMLGLERIRVYRDGYLLEDTPVTGAEVRREVQVPLDPEARWLALKAVDAKGYESATMQIDLRGDAKAVAAPAQGRLYAFSVGVDQYRSLPGLQYAKADALSFFNAVKRNQSHYYRDVVASTLTNAQATQESIFAAVGKIAQEAKPADTIVVYFAGHGVRGDDNEFYFALPGTELKDLRATALSWKALAERLRQLPGRVIVFLDACHSGLADQGATNDDYVGALDGRSLAVLAASKGRQYSLEKAGGGVFTMSLVDVITRERKRFDENHNGVLELSELYAGVKASVVKATDGQQTPWIANNHMVGEVPVF